MQIGELGRQSGLSRDTLRFYEKEGLLGKVPRLENGYRDYPPEL
ncbi:MAG TPA: MerR family transcriptional regulator, partial [Leptospiraceae bacterium]|nr:MerR family transcriptional regulator [Leptospiraceae bacterium]